MPRLKTKDEAYDSCLSQGYVRPLEELNLEKIQSLIENAEININSANIIANAIDKNAKEWMNVFTLYYEAFRIYVEALLHFDKIESSNHQCLFAILCVKYSYLELDWDFIEQLRTKRHGVNYYGERVAYNEWKSVEVQMKLYVSTLRKELEHKISK